MRVEYIGDATLYLGDCLDILPTLGKVDAVVTDPPYPNGEGYFLNSVYTARQVLKQIDCDIALIFWSEIEKPETNMPLVAVHIWHRTNVNGKIYEPIYHFAKDGIKRRSMIKDHAAVFYGVGPGCNEFAGHPTQKPVALMQWCLGLIPKALTILDPFMGSGTTGVACANLGRKFIGIEIEPKYFDIACKRIEIAYSQPLLFDDLEDDKNKPVEQELGLEEGA